MNYHLSTELEVNKVEKEAEDCRNYIAVINNRWYDNVDTSIDESNAEEILKKDNWYEFFIFFVCEKTEP